MDPCMLFAEIDPHFQSVRPSNYSINAIAVLENISCPTQNQSMLLGADIQRSNFHTLAEGRALSTGSLERPRSSLLAIVVPHKGSSWRFVDPSVPTTNGCSIL